DRLASSSFDQVLYQIPVAQIPGPGDFTILASTHAEAGIVLVNVQALRLWQHFQQPCAPVTAFHRLGVAGGIQHYESAVATLHCCGFLSDSPDAPIPFAREDTLIAWLHTTNACNLRCQYCYLVKTNERMDEQIGRQSIDAIFRSALANDYKKVKIKYAGGEATLNFALIPKLHDYARHLAEEQNLSLSGVVLSNGVRLTSEMINSMLARQLRLMISLDGLGADHDTHRHFANGRGSFDAVVRNIEMAKDNGLTPDICITVSGRSAAGLPDLLGWILEHDLPFSLNFYRENELSASCADLRLDEERIIQGMLAAFKVIEANLPQWSLLASLVDRANLSAPHSRPCAAGHNYLVIDHFGRVAKCQMAIDKPVTDISATDPLAVIRSDRRSVQNFSVEEKAGCRHCEWKYWCAGGCPQATFHATGRYDLQSPNCHIYQALYPEVVRLEALRLLKLSCI
ncbi:MAG: radical SAM protein, partial [candidate division KSB1 bacterium]|nr:radical SAM protein [candidate division KSB1 bacterium]